MLFYSSKLFGCRVAWAVLVMLVWFTPVMAQTTGLKDFNNAEAGYGKRYALVIGNSDYKHLPKLDNPRNDASDMCAALKKLGFEAMCFLNQRSKREMKDVVIRFSQKLSENNGVALIFYAGHGMQVKGENYLIPVESQLSSEADMDDEALSVNYLMAQLENSKNPFNVVILDACRDDPVSRGWRSGGRGLAQIDAPVGSVIIFSTSPGKKASDGVGRNGLFTKHLLSNLQAPGLSLEEMVKQVSREVTDESSKAGVSQTPWWNSSFTGTFCFAGCADPSQTKALESIRQEKAQLESDIAKIRKENEDRQATLAKQEVKSRTLQAELEARVKQLETESKNANRQSANNDELAATKQQLSQLQRERQIQVKEQISQKDQLEQLQNRQLELDQKSAQIEIMSRKLAELEREKVERDRLLEDERAKRKMTGEPTSNIPKGRSFDVPPVL